MKRGYLYVVGKRRQKFLLCRREGYQQFSSYNYKKDKDTEFLFDIILKNVLELGFKYMLNKGTLKMMKQMKLYEQIILKSIYITYYYWFPVHYYNNNLEIQMNYE